MNHQVDAVVCGVGSGGTITGLSRFFARVAPETEMILADPQGSALAGYVQTGKPGPSGSYAVEGIGGSCVPKIADLSRVRHAFTVGDRESFFTARELLRKSGILAGSSTGTLVAAALQYCRRQTGSKRVVTFVCDSGNKYLSKLFNDYWMIDQGYRERPVTGTLRDRLAERLSFLQNAVGAIGGPFDSFLALRGLKTLHLRIERHCENALAIAHWLEQHPGVSRVIYPGLESHPQNALAASQMSGFGRMVTATLRGDVASTRRFLENCRLFALAESLGGVESLIEHPAIMTHASLPAEWRRAAAIADTLVRLSVGVEDVEDLKEDLAGAFRAAGLE